MLTCSGHTQRPRTEPENGWHPKQEADFIFLTGWLEQFNQKLDYYEAGRRPDIPTCEPVVDHYLSKEYHVISCYWRRIRQRANSLRQRQLQAPESTGSAQLSPIQQIEPAPDSQSPQTQEPSQPAQDNTTPILPASCNVHDECNLPSSPAEGWVVLKQFATELAAWDSSRTSFPPQMPKPCLIDCFCTAYYDIAQAWQHLEPGLRRAMREFRSPE